MRKIAILSALAALILSTGTVSANDFDALLGDLTFGGSSELQNQTLTMDDIPAEALAPAPQPEPPQGLVPEPIAAPQPMPAPISEPAHTNYQPVAPTSCDTTANCDGGCSSGSCGGRCGRGYQEHCASCVPHTPPNLPTSSFREYFKSDACNCRVWDGWQNRCHGASKHSRGECNCFDPNKGKCCLSNLGGGLGCKVKSFGRGVCPAGPGKATGCLQLPAAWQSLSSDCDGQADCACDSPGCDG